MCPMFTDSYRYPDNGRSIYVGYGCGNFTNTAFDNTGVGGSSCLSSLTIGQYNSCYGSLSGNDVTSGDQNTLIGTSTGRFITTGSRNLCLGNDAGLNIGTGNNNIIIANNGGSSSESYTIRIGEHLTHIGCYLQGITGSTGTDQMVCVTPATGKLGSQPILSMGTIGASSNARQPIADDVEGGRLKFCSVLTVPWNTFSPPISC